MKKYFIYLSLFLVVAMLFFPACSDDSDNPGGINNGGKDGIIDKLCVMLTTRSDDDDSDQPGNDPGSDETFDPEELSPFSLSFDNTSTIFVSQQTTAIPAFQNDEVTYAYNYIPGSGNANWDDGYNFAPSEQDDPLEWFKISNGGSYNGGYSLYALYFPIDNEIRQNITDDGQIRYSVMKDQRDLKDLERSDILGAFHSTDNLFTRLRFKLFHLMTYVRIRLFVPVYDPETKTGYYDNKLKYAELSNVTPEFAVEWSALITTESAPRIVALNGEDEIFMYQHPAPLDNEGNPYHEEIEIEWKKYIPDDYFDQPLKTDYDRVRVYDFSVIMPMQKGIIDEEGKETQFSATNFLNFYIESNAPGVINKYYFNQGFSANSTTSNLQLTQGNFQYLQLYVPRVGNKLIYVTAQVRPWNHRVLGSFPLNPSTK